MSLVLTFERIGGVGEYGEWGMSWT